MVRNGSSGSGSCTVKFFGGSTQYFLENHPEAQWMWMWMPDGKGMFTVSSHKICRVKVWKTAAPGGWANVTLLKRPQTSAAHELQSMSERHNPQDTYVHFFPGLSPLPIWTATYFNFSWLPSCSPWHLAKCITAPQTKGTSNPTREILLAVLPWKSRSYQPPPWASPAPAFPVAGKEGSPQETLQEQSQREAKGWMN